MAPSLLMSQANKERETMPNERVQQRLEKLAQREEIIFAERDKIEASIHDIIGAKLTGTQFLLLRTQFRRWEEHERVIENIHEERYELNQAV